MAYIPWWQRMTPPTFAERFELGGVAGRLPFKHGGSWADWKANFEDQMTFEEYLQMDLKEKKPHFLDEKADGGRIGHQGGQLVRPGVPGVRQGYAGENYIEEFITSTPSKKYKVEIKRTSGTIHKTVDTLEEAQKLKSDFLKTSTKGNRMKPLPEGAEQWWSTLSDKQKSKWKWNIKGKTLAEIWETVGGVDRPSIKDAYENQIIKSQKIKELTKKGYTTLEQFTDEIGAYSGALTRALGLRKMSEGTSSFIAKYPMLKNLIIRSSMASQSGESAQYFIKRPSEEVVDSLKDHFKGQNWRSARRGLLNEDTVKKVQYAFKNKALMENLKNWKKGDKISDDLIKKVFGPDGLGEATIMQLGRVLQGKVNVSGIEKDIKLGNKIIEAMNQSSKKSGFTGWQSAVYKYARSEMDRIIKPGEKSFHGYQRLLHKLFTDAGLKNFNVDEINSIRAGWKSGTSPYTLFSQAIDKRINQNEKRSFDGASSKRQVKLRKALKSGDKKTARQLIEAQDEAIKKFYKNNPGTEGKVKLPSFDLREPWEVFGEKRWASLHPNVKKAITQSWDKVGFSLDVGKGALTQKELAETLQKKIKNKAVRSIALKSIGTMMGLSFAALNQAIGAPIKNIPISEKIPGIGGGEIPMKLTDQVKDISDLLGMVKDWEEGKKVKKIEEEIASQAGSNITGVDQYLLNRYK